MTENLIIQGSNALETIPQAVTPDQYGEIALAEAQKAVDAALVAVAAAKLVKITTEDEYRAADVAMSGIKGQMKTFEAKRDGIVRPFNTVVDRINAKFKDGKSGFDGALGYYRTGMTTYQTKLADERRKAEEAARAEQARLQAIKDEEQRKAKAEFDRVQKEAEDARIAAEQAAQKASQGTEAAAASNAVLDPFEAALAEGNATKQANTAAAEAQRIADELKTQQDAAREAYQQSIRDSRVEVAPVYVPKVTGSGSKTYEVWTYEITDPAMVPMLYRPINEALIAADVKRLKGSTSIPGVKVSSHQEVK